MARKILSFILKLTVVLSSFYGVSLTLRFSSGALLYFTVQSNIWIGVACLIGIILMLGKMSIRKWMYSVKLVLTVSITLTGAVFCVMLAPLYGDDAYSLSNILTHVIVPIASVLDFLIYDYPAAYRKTECLLVTIPPLYYLGFAGIGYIQNWDFGGGVNYPYFFLNWGDPIGLFGFSNQFPFIGILYYILILVVFVIGTGMLYIWLAALIKKIAMKHGAKTLIK